jgi:hypothetical protein
LHAPHVIGGDDINEMFDISGGSQMNELPAVVVTESMTRLWEWRQLKAAHP